ncbi:anion transporter [Methanoculleus sp. Wushi-C6]|uniref:Anion transporter n=1 Tax=Methanoculleus caldifontis TaxID=2651577 RepID=A0ABU3X1X9_9EURY|nr:SLC13 family permease [Methanoculleus sp. Wushi-C6]MDV2482069.1 anion transporter [Methanoculleus sp. Wushi-C6]
MSSLVPIVVLTVVFFLIAVRRIGGINFRIWQVMLLGAGAVLAAGAITPQDALASINLDVMLFLFFMFVIGEALAASGYLYHLSYRLFARAESVKSLVLLILVGAGVLSALLMNDTLAVVGTPLMLYFARRHGISPKLLLLALAFAVTTGSTASPIGNPQNLLIALSDGIENPFVTFPLYLAVPTAISLLLAYAFLCRAFPGEFHAAPLVHRNEEICDPALAALARLSLVLLVLLIGVKVAAAVFIPDIEIRLTWIAVIAAIPVLAGSGRRFELVRRIDWPTLAFFAGLFVLMASVWQSGFFQPLIEGSSLDLAAVPVIAVVSVVVSQFVSNVPFVALSLPVLEHLGASTVGMMALAAGSTIAGNMLILGAASNVIIIQGAEKEGETLTFGEFARIGVPLTVAQTAVYVLFLSLLPV